MPIYEYKCENGHVFDVMQRISDDPLAECVECNAPVRKVLHPVGISFKGSGFYSTDYGNGKAESPDKIAAKKNGDSGGDAKKPEKATKAETSKKQD